jgi:hypothetical protein
MQRLGAARHARARSAMARIGAGWQERRGWSCMGQDRPATHRRGRKGKQRHAWAWTAQVGNAPARQERSVLACI